MSNRLSRLDILVDRWLEQCLILLFSFKKEEKTSSGQIPNVIGCDM